LNTSSDATLVSVALQLSEYFSGDAFDLLRSHTTTFI